MDVNKKIILLGGSSHSGKTTLGKHLAGTLDFDYCATDTMARHPGRPWNTPQWQVPSHVIEHYTSLSVQELFQDVLEHYRVNVIPQIKTIINKYLRAPSSSSIIIEGSAIWPDYILDMLNKNYISGIWLIADDTVFQERIYKESGFYEKTSSEQVPIRKFLDRTIFYNAKLIESLKRHNLNSIDISKIQNINEITENVV